MKNQELLDKTINILVKAYFDGILERSECAACAVGNIVASNCDYKISKDYWFIDKDGNRLCPKWQEYIWAFDGTDRRFINEVDDCAKFEVESTGYSVFDLVKIERAFMKVDFTISHDDRNYNGLMRVVDVLMSIHEGTEKECESAKLLFA